MKTDTTNTDTIVLSHTEAILKLAKEQVYSGLATKENLGITTLSEEIAKTRGVEQGFVYAVISAYIETNPELHCAKGRGGGIMWLATHEKRQAEAKEVAENKTATKFTKNIEALGFKDKAHFESAKRKLGEKPTIKALKEWLLNGQA